MTNRRSCFPDQEYTMHQNSFDTFVRRASDLLNRRSIVGGLSGALLTLGGVPIATDARKGKHRKSKNKKSKACKKRVKLCNSDLRDDVCEGNDECLREVGKCCKKACQSTQKAIDCCENTGFCL